MPFGEYVPLRPLFEMVPALDRVPRDMVRGREQVLFDLDGVRFGSVISYEGAYARYEREAVRAGAAFLVLATNEASFGRTPASDQLIAISRMRAAELGVDLVHAAVTGKSASFTPMGGWKAGPICSRPPPPAASPPPGRRALLSTSAGAIGSRSGRCSAIWACGSPAGSGREERT